MNGYYLAEAAASRHEDLLRTAALRRRARDARPRTRRIARHASASSGDASSARRRGPVELARAFLYRGWIAPPAGMVRGSVPGDGRGAVAGNLAFGPAGTATCPEFRVAAGHGAS
jgi:hypothetical protein